MAELRLARGREMAGEAGDWLTRAARTGYAAKGVVYLLIGWLALRAAWGRGSPEDSRGALDTLLAQPFGRVLLAIMAAGLLGYTAWRAYCAVADPEHEGAGKRLFYGLVAVIHGGLTVEAARMALQGRQSQGGGDSGAADWTARLMEQPFGVWLVGLVGVAIGAYGLLQLRHAWTAELDDQLDLSPATPTQRDWIRRISRFGIAARGLVFVIVAWFLVQAAVDADAGAARGLGGALRALEQQPHGRWVLTATALGLVAYGVYQLVRARYRVIRTG